MSDQPDCDKRQVGLRVEIETCRKVEKKYGQPEDGRVKSLAFVRALEDATRGVKLTADDYAAIAAEARRNEARTRTKKASRRATK